MGNHQKIFAIPMASVVATSVVATSAMTTFSYIISRMKGDNFREPLLLTDFLRNSLKAKRPVASSLGWVVHYDVGFLFGLLYESILKKHLDRTSVGNGVCFGLLAGAVAVPAWAVLFRLHPDKPKINYLLFFKQLLIAHIIFGLVSQSCPLNTRSH